jgi:hypothetical protein
MNAMKRNGRGVGAVGLACALLVLLVMGVQAQEGREIGFILKELEATLPAVTLPAGDSREWEGAEKARAARFVYRELLRDRVPVILGGDCRMVTSWIASRMSGRDRVRWAIAALDHWHPEHTERLEAVCAEHDLVLLLNSGERLEAIFNVARESGVSDRVMALVKKRNDDAIRRYEATIRHLAEKGLATRDWPRPEPIVLEGWKELKPIGPGGP